MFRRLHRVFVVILALIGAALACSIEVSTAHLENLRTYKAPSREEAATRNFAPGDTIYALADLKDARHPLQIEAVWVQVIEDASAKTSSEVEIAREAIQAENGPIILAQEPPGGAWAPGTYRLICYLDGVRELTTEFRVR